MIGLAAVSMRGRLQIWNSQRANGSVLLEVVLALFLFVAAATIITSGMNASVQAVQKLRANTHAMNLAISLISELQMHARPLSSAGPEAFEPPFQKWNWKIDVNELESGPLETDAMKKVEVTVRNTEEQVVYRLTQLFRAADVVEETQQTQAPANRAPQPSPARP